MTDLSELVGNEARLARMEAEAKAKMSPAGALGLHPLVDARRLEYLVPDAAFTHTAMFDRIIVVQLPEREGDTFIKGGLIVRTQKQVEKDKIETPRGIIISAGLGALDQLASNGCGLGHIVRFIRNAPYRFIVDDVGGVPVNVMLMRAGDIVSSEDLFHAIRDGKASVTIHETVVDGQTVRTHLYKDPEGKTWLPQAPWISDDM